MAHDVTLDDFDRNWWDGPRGAAMRLEDVDPHLVRALQVLFDEFGPAGVANVVALMRGEAYGPPPPTGGEIFTERRQHAAERAYTTWPPRSFPVVHEGEGKPCWDNYSG